MPKIHVRTLYNFHNQLWDNQAQRDLLRDKLNMLGFYVLTNEHDGLEVFVIKDRKWYE